MIDNNIQHCFIKSLIDVKIDPTWLSSCNFVNYYSGNNIKSNNITCIFLTDDRCKLLYVTNKIFAEDSSSGLPWSQKYEIYLKNITPSQIVSFSFSYSGLFFCEYSHKNQMNTLHEFMLSNQYDSSLFSTYLKNIIPLTKFHLLPFCFSEELLLVDQDNNLLLPSHNFILSITYPVPLDICKMFKNRLHPLLLSYINKIKTNSSLKSTRIVANSGLHNPTTMKKLCTRIIEKDASLDRIYFMSTFIYYFASVATFWKLRKQFVVTHRDDGKKRRNLNPKECLGICSHSSRYLGRENLKEIIHNYLCVEVTYVVPVKLKKASALYSAFNACIMDLEGYLIKLENISNQVLG